MVALAVLLRVAHALALRGSPSSSSTRSTTTRGRSRSRRAIGSVRPAVRFLAGFGVLYSLSAVAFFIFSRYRIQVVPALLPLAALDVAELVARLRA